MPYIIKLLNDSRVQEVVVVSDEVTSKERINMGWQQDITKEAETLKIFIHPEIDIVEKLLHKDQENHGTCLVVSILFHIFRKFSN